MAVRYIRGWTFHLDGKHEKDEEIGSLKSGDHTYEKSDAIEVILVAFGISKYFGLAFHRGYCSLVFDLDWVCIRPTREELTRMDGSLYRDTAGLGGGADGCYLATAKLQSDSASHASRQNVNLEVEHQSPRKSYPINAVEDGSLEEKFSSSSTSFGNS
jgi:hypothetical protein